MPLSLTISSSFQNHHCFMVKVYRGSEFPFFYWQCRSLLQHCYCYCAAWYMEFKLLLWPFRWHYIQSTTVQLLF